MACIYKINGKTFNTTEEIQNYVSSDEFVSVLAKGNLGISKEIRNLILNKDEKTNEVREIEDGQNETKNEGIKSKGKNDGQKTNDVQNEEVTEGGVKAPDVSKGSSVGGDVESTAKTMDDFDTFKDAVAYNVKRTADIGIDESEANYGDAKNINEIKLDLEKAGIQIEKVSQSSMSDGNYASFDGEKIKVTDENIPLQVLLHEIGEKVVLDLDKAKQKIEHANNIFEAVTTYGASRGNDAFADNFYLYFLSPKTLKELSPNVYAELNKLIPQNIKDLGKSLMSKYGVTEQTLKYNKPKAVESLLSKEQSKAGSESKSSEPSKSDKNYQEAQEVNAIVSKENPDASVLIQPKGNDLSLTAVYVGKEKRGKGIGSKVLESVKKQADKLGKKVVLDATNELDSETDLEKLDNFYKKNGFLKVGENKYEYDPKAKDSSGDIVSRTDDSGTKKSDIAAVTNKGQSDKNVDSAEEVAETSKPKPENVKAIEEATEKEITTVAEKASITPKNAKDLYKVNRKLFGLNKVQALASAITMDRMVGAMAKRAGITKTEMYGRLKFEKASEDFVKNLSKKAKVLWQIVGENANLSQTIKDNLRLAREMELAGKDAKTIRLATGWEKGADKKWKFEIFSGELKGKPRTIEDKLSNLLDNKELFEMYPQLKDINVNLRLNGFGTGNYSLTGIVVNGGIRDMLSILNHEVQHAIQDIEGFARGANLETISEDLYNIFEKYERVKEYEISELKGLFYKKDSDGWSIGNGYKTREEAEEALAEEKLNLKKISDIYSKLIGNAITEKEAFDLYKKTAGEVESRNVQKRMEISNEQKRNTLLSETEDIARDEQIVLFQKSDGNARGAAMVSMDGQAVIYALTDPNVSTPLHELAHVFEHYLTDAEKLAVKNWAGTKQWDVQTSEKFARGFEKYLAEDKAPNSALEKVFANFKEWLTEIYNGIVGSDIDIELNDDMRELYSKMLGEDFSTQKQEATPQVKEANVKAIEEAMTKKSGTIKNEIIKEAADPTEVKKILDNLDAIKSKLAGFTTKDGDRIFSEECKWG